MPLPGAVNAEFTAAPSAQTADQIAKIVQGYLEEHAEAVVLEDGKAVFELAKAQHKVSDDHGHCTLELWSGERNLVRTVVAAKERNGALRLSTKRFGHTQTKVLVIDATAQRREPSRREPARQQYLRVLQRVLSREFHDWNCDGFRAAMDLERSFGPAYTRGSQVRGNEAWAVIGIGVAESQTVIDGILTLGVLWLHHCRERSDGRRLYKGLRLIVPRGGSMLTLARLPWMNAAAAQWELYELDERTEELFPCDPADQGNLRTRLAHLPDQAAARERFALAIEEVMALVSPLDRDRVEQRLRSTAELAFLLHGLEFARVRISLAQNSFTHTLEITVGVGPAETALTQANRPELAQRVRELFARRHPGVQGGRRLRPYAPSRGIGTFTGKPAHTRMLGASSEDATGMSRLELRERALAAQQDPLFRALPERWLESVLRENLAPLTRSLGPPPGAHTNVWDQFANEGDPDTFGNRASGDETTLAWGQVPRGGRAIDRLIPRFDPRFVYSQVPAIAGASDRGMLDLLGMTRDGRLAVIEVKASDDLQLALQGLDYWIRVRHHHTAAHGSAVGPSTGSNDLQQHGYFRGVELSLLPPRLYLVAPALQIHPATETVLRYVSPKVEWTLLALDERWRQEVRVVWRKSGGSATGTRTSL